MRGIADGSGVEFKYLKRIHMIGELTKGACSMFGAWGKATSKGQTIQLRSLDWVQIIIYRISMDLITNSLLLQFTILVVLSMAILGWTSALWDGLVYFQALTKSSLQFHKLESLTQMKHLENKVDSVIPLLSSWEMYFNGIKLSMNLSIVCRLLREHAILF